MKKLLKSGWAAKIVSCAIVMMVLMGTALLPAVAEVGGGDGSGPSLVTIAFFGFLGAIVAVQVIPAFILFAMMVKGVFSLLTGKKDEAVEDTK